MDYTPVYVPGKVLTLFAGAAVSGGDLLVVSASNTVIKAASGQAPNVVGVAASDTPVNGRVTVYARGTVHESVADGAITAGDQITSTATANRSVTRLASPSAVDLGAAYTQATVNAAVNGGLNAVRGIIGIALTSVADNQKVRWMEF